MKYFKKKDELYSDFDGVYLNSQELFNEVMQGETSLDSWMKYLNSIDWKDFFKKCERIPEAKETFLELQELGILKGFITRIHSFDEGIEKGKLLRADGIIVPIYYVLPEQPKSVVIIPNSNKVLLEDDPKNTEDWELKGGHSILYNPSSPACTKKMIKKLPNLLSK